MTPKICFLQAIYLVYVPLLTNLSMHPLTFCDDIFRLRRWRSVSTVSPGTCCICEVAQAQSPVFQATSQGDHLYVDKWENGGLFENQAHPFRIIVFLRVCVVSQQFIIMSYFVSSAYFCDFLSFKILFFASLICTRFQFYSN